MNAKWILAAGLVTGICGCSNMGGHDSTDSRSDEKPEPGEIKVKLEETPMAVQKSIETELVGADLEDAFL